jgi:glutamyl-tRNA synthetase
MREKARAEGKTYLRRRLARLRPGDAPPGIARDRPKAPLTGETVVEDCRAASPGRTRTSTISCCCAPTVTDPHAGGGGGRSDMGVTRIIRGDDHLNNGARQTQIYQALG